MTDVLNELQDPETCSHAEKGYCQNRACMAKVVSKTGSRFEFVGCLNYRAAAEIERLRRLVDSGAARQK